MKTLAATLIIVSALTTGGIVSQAADQDAKSPQRGDKPAKGGGGEKAGGGRDMLFALLDADQDGFLSLQELQNAPAVLAKIDKNGDGNLTQEELAPAKGGKGSKGGKGKGSKPGQKGKGGKRAK